MPIKKINIGNEPLLLQVIKSSMYPCFCCTFFVTRGSLIIISHSCSIAIDLPPNIVIEVLRQEFPFYSHTYVGTVGWVNDTLWMRSHLPLWKR